MASYNLSVLLKVIDKTTVPIKKIGKSFNGLSSNLNKLGNSFKKVAKVSAGMAVGFVAAGTKMFQASVKLNKSMANIATLMPDNLKRVEELKIGIQKTAISVGKSTTDMSDGMYQVISAFGDSSESLQVLKINAKAAVAGLSSTTDAINLTSAVTKGYGDVTAKAIQKASDLAFVTVKLGQTTFPELASSLGRVVPLAAKLNVKQEELFAGFATLTGVTGNASEVSTQMAAILRAMLKPTTDMKNAIESLGYESASVMLKEKGLAGSLNELMGVTKGNEEATAALFGRAEALTSVFALTGAQAKDYTKKLGSMKRAQGATNRAFKEQTDGINKSGHAWEQMKVALTVLMEKAGDQLSPLFEKLSTVMMNATKNGSGFLKVIKGIGWFAGKAVDSLSNLFDTVELVTGAFSRNAAEAEDAKNITAAYMKEADKRKIILQEKYGKDWLKKGREKKDKEYIEYLDLMRKASGFREKQLKYLEQQIKIKERMKGSEVRPNILNKDRTKSEVHIKVSADQGTTATIEKIKKNKGTGSKVLAQVDGFVGIPVVS